MQELSYGYVAPEAFKGWDHVEKHFQLVRKQYRDYLDSEAAEEVETKIDHEQQFREINEPTFSPRSLSLPFPLLPLEAPSGVEGVATEVDPRKGRTQAHPPAHGRGGAASAPLSSVI